VTALAELEKKVSAAAGSAAGGFGFFGFAVPGEQPTTLRQVSAALGALLGIVEGADVAPSADATKASAKWQSAGTATLAQWEAIQSQDVARANLLLQKAGLQPLKSGGEKDHP
jgi:hypothetical protein